MNGRLRSPSSQCKLDERIHRYLKPGALAQIRDSRISARFRRQRPSKRPDSVSIPCSPRVSTPPQQHALNDFLCFPSPRLFGPRCPQRKKLVAMNLGLVCPASSTPVGTITAGDSVLELSGSDTLSAR